MKHTLERSKLSDPAAHPRSSNQMQKQDRDELIKLLKEMTPEEIVEVKRAIDEFEKNR